MSRFTLALLTAAWWSLAGAAGARDLSCVPVADFGEARSLSFDTVAYLKDASCDLDVSAVATSYVEAPDAWRVSRGSYYDGDYNACHWHRVCLRFDRAMEAFLETGIHAYSEAYVFRDGALVGEYRMGNNVPLARRATSIVWPKAYRNLAPLEVTPGEYVVYFKAYNPTGPNIFSTYATHRLRLWRRDHVEARATTHHTVTAFVSGWLVLLILYQAVLYAMSRHRIILWYLVYMVSQLAYLAYEDFIVVALFPETGFEDAFLALTITVAPYCFFCFMRVLLDEVDYRPRISRLLKFFASERLGLGIIWLALILLRKAGWEGAVYLLGYVGIYYRVVLLVQILATVPIFIDFYRRSEHPAAKALTLGNLSLAACIFIYVSEVFLDPLGHYSAVAAYLSAVGGVINYLIEIGIIIMSLAFAVAVALVVQARERERERDASQRLLRMEMSALRAQMNPHFLFNGLNSIKLFVIRNQPREASDYLTRFSRLIRLILENSAESMVSLRADLQALRLYVELESLRFEGRFDYRFDIGEVDASRVLIPPTLLQPYVENAIWHGLLHRSQPGGLLQVRVREPRAREIVIEIEDNGVGRAAARLHRSRSATKHKSLGMRITQDRLDLLGAAYGFSATVTVEDKFEGDVPAGTRVTIRLSYADADRTDSPSGPPQGKNARRGETYAPI